MKESVKKIFKDTIMEFYPMYIKKDILMQVVEEGLVINNKKRSNQLVLNFTDSIDVTELDSLDEKVAQIIENDSILSFIEENEFKKQYRHFCYFAIKNIHYEKIEELVKQNQLNVFDKKDRKLVDDFDIPTIFINGELIYLKFSKKLINDVGKEIKYTMLCIIDKEEEVLEFRFDRIGIAYKNTYTFYKDRINEIIEYLATNIGLEIIHIDFKAVIDFIKSEIEDNDITIYAQKMNRNGTIAYLEAYDDEYSIMPILGELNNLIEANTSIFEANDETMQIRKLLQDFISDIEIKSDMPMVKIKMDKLNIKFGITHNYKGSDFSLFMFYGDLVGDKERMNNVKKYLIGRYRELNSAVSTHSISTE